MDLAAESLESTGHGRFTVAEIVDCYLRLSEPFIYDAIASLRAVQPMVVARTLENLELFPLPGDARLVSLSAPRSALERIRDAISWPIDGVRRPFDRLLRRGLAKLIHAHFGPIGCEMVPVKQRTMLPLVTSFYGYDASMSSVLNALEVSYRTLFAIGDVFLAEGPAMAQRLNGIGCPIEKIRIQKIGIDLGRYRVRDRTNPGTGQITLLQCARMVPKKGYETTLAAFALARREAPRLQLRIIGDGPDAAKIHATIRELDLEESVILLGAQPRRVFLQELDSADLFVQPSRTAPDGDCEGGAPTTLLEAQAMGVPILATRHADIPNVVREGESAWLCDEGDAPGLAANMVELAHDPVRWPVMGRQGRRFVEAEHDLEVTARALETVYASLVC